MYRFTHLNEHTVFLLLFSRPMEVYARYAYQYAIRFVERDHPSCDLYKARAVRLRRVTREEAEYAIMLFHEGMQRGINGV